MQSYHYPYYRVGLHDGECINTGHFFKGINIFDKYPMPASPQNNYCTQTRFLLLLLIFR